MPLAAVCYPEVSAGDFERMQKIRSVFDIDNYNLINPHFTLIFPFTGITQKDLSNHVKSTVINFKAVNFAIQRSFIHEDKLNKTWYLFFIPDEGSDNITKLHDELFTGIMSDKLRKDIPYIPHITVGVFNDEQKCQKQSKYIKIPEGAIKGRITAVDLISIEDNRVETINKIDLL